MVNFIWSLLLIFLGEYVKGEIKRVDFRRREDLANVMFSDNPILFSRRTQIHRCVEKCLYIGNCFTVVSSGEGDNGECYLYDKQTADMTNQASSASTHVFNKVSVSSNDVSCLIEQTNLQPITTTTPTTTTPTTTTPTTTTPTSTTSTTTTSTTTPGPTYLQYYSKTLNWGGARTACQAEGGDLAILDTPEEIKTVENTVTGYYVWTGHYRSAPSADFTWVDGRAMSGVNWKTGHPRSGEMCGLVAISGVVYFKTDDCSKVTDYICELPVV